MHNPVKLNLARANGQGTGAPGHRGTTRRLLAGAWIIALALSALVAKAQSKITVERVANGAKLTYEGTLQSAEAVTGPWADVAGASSPSEVKFTSPAKFYRALGAAAPAGPVTYTYKTLFKLAEEFSGTGETLSKVIELGNANTAGTVTGVSDYGDGEGAWLVDADGKGKVLSRPGLTAPAGGTYGGGINGKISLNNNGNAAFGVDVNRGDGNKQEVVYYDRKADKWTSIARNGTAVKGGTITATLSFATINDANDVVFAANLDSGGSGVYLYDGTAKTITAILEPGNTVGGKTIINARRVQISQIGRIITFEAQVDGDASFGAYQWKDAVVTELVAFGAKSPDQTGKETDITFDELRGPIANSGGDVATLGHTADGWGAYLRTRAGKLTRIAGPGDAVAGEKIKGVGNSYRNDVRIAADGSVLFSAIFENDERGLYLQHPSGTLTEVARVGKELKGIGKVTGIGLAIGGDSGFGISTDGKLAFPVGTEDGAVQLVLARPVAPPPPLSNKTYSNKSLFSLAEPFSTTGESLTLVIEVGNANNAGTVTGVSNYGDGEGAWMVDADGKGKVLSRPGLAVPSGGTFGGGINGKISLNNSGNAAFGVDIDRGDGNKQEVVYYDRKADKWTSIARNGTVVKGGTITATLSFATMNDANDVVFAANLDSGGSGVYLYAAATQTITAILEPGNTVGGKKIANARRVQVSQIGRIITFEAQVDGDGSFGAYQWKDGVVTELIAFGSPSPDQAGILTGPVFGELRGPIANSSGDVATLGATSDGWGAYLRTRTGKLTRIAGPGDSMPGGVLKGVGNSYRNDVRIAEDGSVLFNAIFNNDERGLFLKHPNGTVTEVARVGKDLKGIGKVTGIGLAIGGDSGFGISTDGKLAFPAGTADGKVQLILATPN
jgi:hypothetical protein